MWKAVNIHLSCAQPRPRYASFFRRFSGSSQLTKPAWSAGRKAAQVTRKMRGARTQRSGGRTSARGGAAPPEAAGGGEREPVASPHGPGRLGPVLVDVHLAAVTGRRRESPALEEARRPEPLVEAYIAHGALTVTY